VQRIEVRRFSAGRTIGLVGGLIGGFLVAGLISCASSDDDYC
jgi:hypothetical protein